MTRKSVGDGPCQVYIIRIAVHLRPDSAQDFIRFLFYVVPIQSSVGHDSVTKILAMGERENKNNPKTSCFPSSRCDRAICVEKKYTG